MPESACVEKNVRTRACVRSLPFADIPGQSQLFLDFLKAPKALGEFYPSAVDALEELKKRIPEVLAAHAVDRNALSDVLAEQNRAFGSTGATLENIERLRSPDCVAVVTGQQAGLFTGPLYTIYKALTAARSAAALREAGVNAVPVFWIATEDHDLEEVSKASALSSDGRLIGAAYTASAEYADRPVGEVTFDGSVQTLVERFFDQLPQTAFSDEIRELTGNCYRKDETFGSAFGRLMAMLAGNYGLIFLEPQDVRLKRLAAPLFRDAIELADDIVQAIIARGSRLVSAGYHTQVQVEESYFPLFWISDDGQRLALRKVGDGRYRASRGRQELTRDDLAAIASNEPERLSPGVMLRAVVQDNLLPTLCYYGGGAEVAYFAQKNAVYRVLGRPVTPIFHRQSFTLVEPRHARTMRKFAIDLPDLFAGYDALLPSLVERYIDPETPRVFDEVAENVNAQLDRLDRQLAGLDPTLVRNLNTRRRKVSYHLAALRSKFQRARMEKDAEVHRRMQSLFVSLYPNGGLQERTLNVVEFLNKYGKSFVDTVYRSIDVDSRDHQVLYL